MMTSDEATDLSSVVQSVRRIEARLVSQDARDAKRDERIDRLEKVADQMMAVMTFVKWLASFLGLGGIATFLVLIAQSAGK